MCCGGDAPRARPPRAHRHIASSTKLRHLRMATEARVWRKDVEPGPADGEPRNVETPRTADQQLQRRSHCAEIGAEIDRIRDQQQSNDRVEPPARVMRAD